MVSAKGTEISWNFLETEELMGTTLKKKIYLAGSALADTIPDICHLPCQHHSPHPCIPLGTHPPKLLALAGASPKQFLTHCMQ